MKHTDLINWANLSKLLTGRKDVIRHDRISKTYLKEVKELETLIRYWLSTIKI